MYETERNLQAAFSGESQASNRYLVFAEKAEKEGYPQIARLFRAVAEAEIVHARNHFNSMDAVGSIKDNLLAGANVEHYEHTRVYPLFAERAREENNERARVNFEQTEAVEEGHRHHFEDALDAVKTGRSLKEEPYFICQQCGYTADNQAPEKCPVCGEAAVRFKRVD
jgi:rubrerythrin